MARKKENHEDIKAAKEEVAFNTSLLSMADQIAGVMTGQQDQVYTQSTSDLKASQAMSGLPKGPEPFHMDADSLAQTMTGASVTPGATHPAFEDEGPAMVPTTVSSKGNMLLKSAGEHPSPQMNIQQPVPQQTGDLSPIANEFHGFKFASDVRQSQAEMKEIAHAVREKLAEIKARRVVNNTQSLAKSAKKFYTMKGGLRVDFSILGQKLAMRAKGEFFGDEFFHVAADGDTPTGRILRIQTDGSFDNVTHEYDVSIEQIK